MRARRVLPLAQLRGFPMARPAKPWFWKERDGWFISLNGKRIPLAKGKAQDRALSP